MQCNHCGETLMQDDQFCPNCGRPVEQQARPGPQTNRTIPKPERGKIPPWLWVVLVLVGGVLCCGLLAVGGFYLYSDQGQEGVFQMPQANPPGDGLQGMPTAQPPQTTGENTSQEQPPATETAAPLPTADPPDIQQEGLRVWFDEDAMRGVRPVTVEETLPGGYIPWEYAPQHLSLEVQDPPGVIHLVPVDAYVPMGDFAGETIRELRSVLENRPAVAAWGCIPTWDFPCPHQEMNIHISYFDFQNGSGIRSVTVYAVQNTSAINNEAIDYYYNGLTEDGLYYVYARFDLRHTALSEDDWTLPLDVMTEAEALKEYVISYGEMLESSADEYQPKLDVLDAVIQSLRVEVQ